MATLEQNIGARIRKEREALGWSQGEFAKRLGWPRLGVINLEKGERKLTFSELVGIVGVLGVPVTELVASTEPALVGDQHVSPEELRQRVAGTDATTVPGWERFLGLVGLCRALDQISQAVVTATRDVQALAASSPELAAAIKSYERQELDDIMDLIGDDDAATQAGAYGVPGIRAGRYVQGKDPLPTVPGVRASRLVPGKDALPLAPNEGEPS